MLRHIQTIMLTMWAALVTAFIGAAPLSAQSVADFYKDKTIDIVVGYTPGGGYDLAARVLSRHMGKYMPGEPKMIVRNMPGAGTVLAANHVNNVAPKDGTVIGIYADLMPVAKLLDVPGVQFDPAKFGWIGSITSRGMPTLILRKDAPATTLQGIREKEVLIGASGPDATSSYAYLLNDLLDTKLMCWRVIPAERRRSISRSSAARCMDAPAPIGTIASIYRYGPI